MVNRDLPGMHACMAFKHGARGKKGRGEMGGKGPGAQEGSQDGLDLLGPGHERRVMAWVEKRRDRRVEEEGREGGVRERCPLGGP